MRILRRGHRHINTETLSEYLDGRLSGSAASRVEEEADGCPECREELDSLRFTVSSLHSMAQVAPLRTFTLADAPPAYEESQGARSATPLRMPGWVYVGAAAAAVLVIGLILYGNLPGLISPASSPVEEQALSHAPATAVEIAPLGGQVGDRSEDGKDMSAAATSAPLAMAESAPAPDDAKPQTRPTPASVAAAGEPDVGRMEATRATTLTHDVEAATEKSPQSESSMLATISPSPTAPPPAAVTPIAMAARQEMPATSAVEDNMVAKEVVKEIYRSDPPVTPSPSDSAAVGASSPADAQVNKSAMPTDTRPGTAVREVTPTLEILGASPTSTLVPSQVVTTLPKATPTPAQVEKLETKESMPTVTDVPAVAATSDGPRPAGSDPAAESTSVAVAMTSQPFIPTPELAVTTSMKSQNTAGSEVAPEPDSPDSAEIPLSSTGALLPALALLGVALAVVLTAAVVIRTRLSRRRKQTL